MPEKLLEQVDSHLVLKKGVNKRRLLDQSKKRPPAWEYPHFTSADYKKLDGLIAEYSNTSKFCSFLSQPCIEDGIVYFMNEKRAVVTKRFSVNEVSSFPFIRAGSWGSCALVGFADTILTHKRGKDIDAHDTIIRLGEIELKHYEEYVGSKTDVTWIRRKAKMAERGTILEDRKDSVRLYIGHNNGIPGMPTLRTASAVKFKDGKSISLSEKLYDMFEVKDWNKEHRGKRKKRLASTGFKAATLLILSKFCQRVDLYGFSNNCGGAYYNTRHLMQALHNCELESWFLHHLMQQFDDLNVCVYL
jgi:hypothetical protein